MPRGSGGTAPPFDLQLTDEQRDWLGLSAHESIRVLTTTPRTIMLERTGASGDAAFPWDRDLVLTADVRAFSIADILHLIHASAKSGFLFFQNTDHQKSVFMHRGEVVFAASNQTVDRLGECLLRTDKLTLEQHREAKSVFTPTTRFGKILVERGFLTPSELWNGVKAQVEEIVRSLFSYGSGSVLFWEGEVRPDNVVRLALPTKRLIAEGLRRRDELLKFLAWLETTSIEIHRVEDTPESELSGTERSVFDALARESSFGVICRRAGLDPISGARTLRHLRLIGAVRVEEPAEVDGKVSAADAKRLEADAVRECVDMHLKVLAELAVPIVAVEGGEALRARLQHVIQEAARRFPELLADLEVGPGGAIDPERVVERALRFPGDREREVALAFGELVSYLEFELQNHPKIDDPEVFLEGIEEIRSQL